MYGLPYLTFALFYQLKILRGGNNPTEEKTTCQSFVVGFVLLYAFTEFQFAHNVNDVYPESQGCIADRFRCPFTFSSVEAGVRGVAFTALVVFHLTVCSPFLKVVGLVFAMHFFSRLYGFFAYQNEISTSIWSTSCLCLQFCIFLGCRYTQERLHREKFLTQVQIVRFRSNLQDVLDGLMPRGVWERVCAGETVIDAQDHTAALFCSFPIDAAQHTSAVRAFQLLDRVHLAFDALLRATRLGPACKAEFVGNDYMLTASADSPAALRASLPPLARLAARMADAAERELAGSGLEVRFGLAAGPALAAVMGQTRRHLRVVGEAVDRARQLSARAGPWEVLSPSPLISCLPPRLPPRPLPLHKTARPVTRQSFLVAALYPSAICAHSANCSFSPAGGVPDGGVV